MHQLLVGFSFWITFVLKHTTVFCLIVFKLINYFSLHPFRGHARVECDDIVSIPIEFLIHAIQLLQVLFCDFLLKLSPFLFGTLLDSSHRLFHCESEMKNKGWLAGNVSIDPLELLHKLLEFTCISEDLTGTCFRFCCTLTSLCNCHNSTVRQAPSHPTHGNENRRGLRQDVLVQAKLQVSNTWHPWIGISSESTETWKPAGKHHFSRQQWLLLGVKLIEIHSNLFSTQKRRRYWYSIILRHMQNFYEQVKRDWYLSSKTFHRQGQWTAFCKRPKPKTRNTSLWSHVTFFQ